MSHLAQGNADFDRIDSVVGASIVNVKRYPQILDFDQQDLHRHFEPVLATSMAASIAGAISNAGGTGAA